MFMPACAEGRRRGYTRRGTLNKRTLFFDKKETVHAKAKALSVAEVQGRVGAMIDKRVSRYASVRTDLAPAQVASE